MSNGHRWSKFWWADWQNDPALRMCSLAAQGLWMRLLCVMHEAEPVGHLLVNGKQPSTRQIASLAAASEKEVSGLMRELEDAGVYSRTDEGAIYSRRMVRDAAASAEGRKWGSTGGNPTLKGNGKAPPPGGGLRGGLSPPDKEDGYQDPLTSKNQKQKQSTEGSGLRPAADGPPPDPNRELWNEGVDIAKSLTGRTKASALRLVGQLRAAADEDSARVLAALRQAAAEPRIDPASWLFAAVKPPQKLSTPDQIRRDWNLPPSLLTPKFDDEKPAAAPNLRVVGGSQ